MSQPRTAILHYTAPPVVGGVEMVIKAHVEQLMEAGYAVAVVAGRGEAQALPSGVDLTVIPELDTQHPQILALSAALAEGAVPPQFSAWVDRLTDRLAPLLEPFDALIVHNVFTKHFNLPLTAALYRLLDGDVVANCIAWCHDFTWTSPSSRAKVHAGYPWDLLRTQRADVSYVVVSQRRQAALADLFGCPLEQIDVIYNGVAPDTLLALSQEGRALVDRLGLLESDLVLLMPVRVTRAKHIEYSLRVVAALKGRGYRPKLVVTGPPDPHSERSMDYFRSLQTLRRELQVEQEARFVYESGPDADQPLLIEMDVVGDLLRVSDVVFMPSRREGFGMPVLEAGLLGLPVVCTDIPAAAEIGRHDVVVFNAQEEPAHIAQRITELLEARPTYRLRRRVRQQYTWRAIFERDIEPLLHKGA